MSGKKEGKRAVGSGDGYGKGSGTRGSGQVLFYWALGAGLWIWTVSALASASTGVLPLVSYLFKTREAGQEMVRVNKRVSDLSKKVTALREDPFSMERQAREREHRIREGEILVLPSRKGSP